MTIRTRAERLDHAIDDAGPAPDADLRPLLAAASALRSALPPIPVSRAFEQRLAERLGRADHLARYVWRAETAARSAVRGHGRLIAAGAVSSIAGVATLTAVWVVSRRGAGLRSAALRR